MAEEKVTFNDILSEYQEDTTITRKNIKEKLYDTAVLHAKYSRYLYQWRKLLIKTERAKIREYERLWNFFTDDHPATLNASEKKWHIEVHQDYINLNTKFKVLQGQVHQIEDFCKFCSNISFFTGRIVEYEMFMSGR